MKKRALSILLTMLMLLSAVSCSETTNNEGETTPSISGNDNTVDTTADEVDTENLTDTELRQLIPDDLPDIKYNGQSFRVMVNDKSYVDASYEIVSEEQTGDSLNDSVYNRNLIIEERFDISIESLSGGDSYDQLKTMATSGSSDADIVGIFTYKAFTPINAHAVLNWKEVPYVNFDKPWHNKLANDNGTINGILYAMCSDLSISSMTYTYAIFFNMNMLEDHGYPSSDLYSMVREGTWTIDKMIEISNDIYEDRNGDGKKDKDDIYGFGYAIVNPADVWLTAFDQPICSFNEDNQLEVTFLTDKTVQILEKLIDWHYNSSGFYVINDQYGEEDYFLNQKLAMAPLRFYAAYNVLRTMDAPYSILPYPKWDEAQDRYYTNADDKYTSFVIPTTSYGELDFVGVIYEALSAESYKRVYPVYYNEALKGRYSEEPETAEMVDLIMTGRNFDLSFQFGESYFQRLPYLLRDMLVDEKTDIASAYKKIQKPLEKNVKNNLLPLYSGD